MAQPPAVLITGASSGIGKACALYLDGAGFRVIAGVRKQSDADALRQEASSRLATVFIDVTDMASVEAAAIEVAGLTGNELYGVVNNAGIALGGPLEMLPVEDMQRVLNVNIAGMLAVTRAFLPLLRQSRGRVINMGSSSGILALPALSVYAASKFAVKALSDSLRVELRPFGIAVSILETGNVETPIWEKSIDFSSKLLAQAKPDIMRLYAPLIDFSLWVAHRFPKIPARKVARIIERILRAPHPRPYYLIGADARLFKVAQFIPCRIRDWLFLKILPRYGQP
jgi:NAD(P)-dependent dehydrogenase (short-subunit alcohol dehydrogenase family)